MFFFAVSLTIVLSSECFPALHTLEREFLVDSLDMSSEILCNCKTSIALTGCMPALEDTIMSFFMLCEIATAGEKPRALRALVILNPVMNTCLTLRRSCMPTKKVGFILGSVCKVLAAREAFSDVWYIVLRTGNNKLDSVTSIECRIPCADSRRHSAKGIGEDLSIACNKAK